MSQKLVFMLLKELGGKASTVEVRKLARKKYPDAYLSNYVGLRLHQLRKWGYVDRTPDGLWKVRRKLDF